MKILENFIIITLFSTSSFAVANNSEQSIKFDKKTSQAFNRTPLINKQKNGQISLDTHNSFQNVILTRINKEGILETYCTSSKENAKRFLHGEALTSLEGRVRK